MRTNIVDIKWWNQKGKWLESKIINNISIHDLHKYRVHSQLKDQEDETDLQQIFYQQTFRLVTCFGG